MTSEFPAHIAATPWFAMIATASSVNAVLLLVVVLLCAAFAPLPLATSAIHGEQLRLSLASPRRRAVLLYFLFSSCFFFGVCVFSRRIVLFFRPSLSYRLPVRPCDIPSPAVISSRGTGV